eukprot:3906462-Rhodomonas_salina.3
MERISLILACCGYLIRGARHCESSLEGRELLPDPEPENIQRRFHTEPNISGTAAAAERKRPWLFSHHTERHTIAESGWSLSAFGRNSDRTVMPEMAHRPVTFSVMRKSLACLFLAIIFLTCCLSTGAAPAKVFHKAKPATRIENKTMSDYEFQKLHRRVMKHAKDLTPEQYHLLFSPVSWVDWASPLSKGPQNEAYANQIFQVVVIDVPPLINIEDAAASTSVRDPGNAAQKRSLENGKIE